MPLQSGIPRMVLWIELSDFVFRGFRRPELQSRLRCGCIQAAQVHVSLGQNSCW